MNHLWETLTEFLVESCEFLPKEIPELYQIPEPNEFFNDYVIKNLPFVLRCKEFDPLPAVELWKDHGYLRKLMQKKTVTVAVTPSGRADSIEDDRFMVPEERTMLFDKFFDEFHMPDMHQIYYLQKQNNNLIEEFSPLVRDVGSHVPWATEALGMLPDAVNIWMGDHRSVSSLHRDHYENLYYVITGRKKFILYPPVAISWMPYKKCKKFQWYFEDDNSGAAGKWNMKDLNEEVEWILPSHKPSSLEQLKLFYKTKSFTVDICPGDALYLPSLWFHEVSQTDKCIAVNYWYDMKFDIKYPFFKLLGRLSNLPHRSRRNASVDKQTELESSLLRDLSKRQSSPKRN